MVLFPYVKVHTKHDFTLEDQSATRGCPITPPRCHGEALCHSLSGASVHLKVLMFVWGENVHILFISAYALVLRVNMYPLSKAEVSREYREEKENRRGRKKGKYLSWLERRSKLVFFSPPCLFWVELK